MRLLAVLILTLPLALADAASKKAPRKGLPKTEIQKTLYALGANIARQAVPFHLTPKEVGMVTLGLRDKLLKKTLAVDINIYGAKLRALQAERKAKDLARQKKLAAENEKKGKAFRAKFAKKNGAKASPSGLILIHTKEGAGPSPKPTDTVSAHVKGKLIDGTVINDTVKDGKPMEIPLSRFIKCWGEAFPKIKVGGKATMVCPAAIAFGDRDRGNIPAGSTFIYEVELLKIKNSTPKSKVSSVKPPSTPKSSSSSTRRKPSRSYKTATCSSYTTRCANTKDILTGEDASTMAKSELRWYCMEHCKKIGPQRAMRELDEALLESGY